MVEPWFILLMMNFHSKLENITGFVPASTDRLVREVVAHPESAAENDVCALEILPHSDLVAFSVFETLLG